MNLNEFSPTQPVILGFDPGKDKCGLAVMGLDRQLHYHQVVLAQEAIANIETLQKRYPVSLLVMGNQTTAKQWKQKLQQELLQPLNIMLVDERYSTLEARDRYWQMYPPQGITKLLPKGMRQPPRPIDDIVAVLLIERYLNRLTESAVNSQ
ncbi:resolvase domain-containing protein [Nostoc sp. HK-01]|uniref:Resolvase RNase H domain-containing protein fold protein n=1 Tax=Nostoc cycadae WK-1 TaxID=1861711 RepID=A0A2H6LKY7_9NOSO|nr:pre-16S rRNA-processing nuclease YqgF [Nostoc cycadae]BBD61750.1 resolvase domain-containing protein [Nostoc sp. HK-01]GBE93878.1 resolvase RNase H domain-containing protein fold protein [Nostoc cycadae WK-1]